MAQLVFVHGVATRSGPGYDLAVSNRNALFSEILFADPGLAIHTPQWGDLVPQISAKVFETGKGMRAFSLGIGQPTSHGLGGALGGSKSTGKGHGAGENLTLAALACADPVAALDALFVELIDRYEKKSEPILAAQLTAFARATSAIAVDLAAGDSQIPAGGAAALVGKPQSDQQLGEALSVAVEGPDSYGIGSVIGSAIGAVTDRIRNVASRVAVDPLVDWVRPMVGFFLGDVFAYLHDNSLRAAIRAEVREKLLAAHAERTAGEKLVVIGHSMGGVILLDMLCNGPDADIPADLSIDALFTVGSQPGLFQALNLFVNPIGSPIPRPTCVSEWFNVFDPIDPLAFRCDPIFSGVKDLSFNSITGVAAAHTTYFKRPQFYARARKRLQEIGVIA